MNQNILPAIAFKYMMKKGFSILLSFILLSSHMYLTIGTHFCSGEAVETKILFGETHLGCGMMDMEESFNIPLNNDNKKTHFNKVPCCENEYQTLQSTNEFVKNAAHQYFNVEFSISFIFTNLNIDILPKSIHQFYTQHISPPLEKDIQVLFQTFLI